MSLHYFTLKKLTNANIYYKHHYINTVSLQHVSALKGPSSLSTTDTLQKQGQQNELPDVNQLSENGVLKSYFPTQN
jgi:hypothetical protein